MEEEVAIDLADELMSAANVALEKAGLHTMVGKVNMDRNSPDILREKSVSPCQ